MKEEITYDDFSRLDIRIGTIIAAERVPDTDKLLKCVVDFGDPPAGAGMRTIISGIAEAYAPEDFIGKQCPYIVNLASREIRGIMSEGMLLAASGDGISLLHPDRKLSPGSKIG